MKEGGKGGLRLLPHYGIIVLSRFHFVRTNSCT